MRSLTGRRGTLGVGWILLAGLVAGPLRAQDACDFPVADDPRGEAVADHLEAAVGRGFSGAVLVEIEGAVVHCAGHGWTDSTRTHPVSPGTLFFIASITKQLTAAGILLLEEDGALDLSDPLGQFFPPLGGPASRIELHRLLTHTAGLAENYQMDGIAARDSAVQAVFTALPAAPAADFHYTNDAYGVLAAVIEAVSGQSFEAFVARRLLAPSGMRSTAFWGLVDDRDVTRFAQKSVERSPEMQLPNWGYRGASGIWSSVEDLYRWVRTAWRGDLIGAESRSRLFGPHLTLSGGTGIGYGTFTSTTSRGTREIWARGTEDFGHNAVIRWLPEEAILVVLVSNSGEIEGIPANQRISGEILEQILEESSGAGALPR